MFAGPQTQNGFTLTMKKMKLDAVFLVLGVDDFESLLAQGFDL